MRGIVAALRQKIHLSHCPNFPGRLYHRRETNGALFGRVTVLIAANKPSVDFCGYWQRSKVEKLAA